MLDDFGHAADICGDYGDFAGHGFEGGEAEGFELRGKQKKIGSGEFFVDVVLFAEEENVLLKFFLRTRYSAAPRSGPSPMRTSLAGILAADNGENLNGIGKALDGAEIRQVHEDAFAVGSPLAARPLSAVRL